MTERELYRDTADILNFTQARDIVMEQTLISESQYRYLKPIAIGVLALSGISQHDIQTAWQLGVQPIYQDRRR